MRRPLVVLVALVAAGAGGLTWSQEREPAPCPTTVALDGVSYTPARAGEEVISGRELGIGQERGCGWRGPYTDDIGLNAIPGVNRGLAVASSRAAHLVYLAPGVTPDELPEGLGTVTLLEGPQR